MSTTKNIQMMEFNRQDYDVLYPAINENSIENLYLWEKGYWKNKDYHLETFSKKEQGMFGVASDSGIDIFYSDSYEVSLGVVSLVQPQSIFCSFHSAPSTLNVLRGKYCSRSPQNNTSIWQVPTGATFTSLQNAGVATFYSSERYYTLTDFSEQEYFEIESFLCSKNKDEYSNAQDGYQYILRGRVGERLNITSGIYKGTRTYGSTRPNILTFNFCPKILIIHGYALMAERGNNQALVSNNGVAQKFGMNTNYNLSHETKWYNTVSAEAQCNKLGQVYRYTAIE